MKLQSRITISNTVMVVVTVITFSMIQVLGFHFTSNQILEQTSTKVSQSLLSQLEQRAAYTANYLSDALINPIYKFDMEGVHELLEPALKSDEVLAIVVFDASGNTFHTGQRIDASYGIPFDMPDVKEAVLKLGIEYQQVVNNQLLYAKPLYIGDELLGGLFLKLSVEGIEQDIAQTRSIIENINLKASKTGTLGSALLAFVFCVVSIVVSFLITRTIISPVTLLVEHARRITQGDYLHDNTIDRNDEVGELANTFNEMSASLKERTEAIEFLAYHDHLTELPNRTLFIKQVSEVIDQKGAAQQHSLAILFIDLDEFKGVNDNFGHHAGDLLLCEVSSRLTSKIIEYQNRFHHSVVNGVGANDVVSRTWRTNRGIVSRIGGDEFLLCVPYSGDIQQLFEFSNSLLDSLCSPISVGVKKEPVVISGSIGIATYPNDGVDAEELIKHADIAMYQAKAMGKRTYSHFTDEMRKQVRHKAWIERKMRVAMSDMSQFEVWYQPFFDIKTRELLGAEALVRWNMPNKGILCPDDFIPIAEATGLIVPIGEWITEQVCSQLQEWEGTLSPDFYVSVNLSAKQLYRQQIVDVFRNQLEVKNIPPCRIHAEVTESLLMQNEDESLQTLISLRELGIQVWLDDFGTGYSSLGYLRKFQVDGVKIDRSFVADIEVDSNDRALCSTIISMARDLNLAVVAEGIEKEAQAYFLQEKGCRIGQGELVSGPLKPQSFEQKFCQQTQH